MVVDERWSLIGSTNWDPRSLRLNFECDVECYDGELAKKLSKLIDEKISRAHPVSLQELNARSLAVRLRDGLARLFTPYL
jgi:cardiolipin synthase